MKAQRAVAKEPQINTATYREAQEKQIGATVDSGDEATDELITAITQAVNKYMMRLAEKQIRIAFDQAEKEVQDLHQRTKEGKFDQRGNSEHGNARLELRRLNLSNESVPFVVKEWRDMFKSINKRKYVAMLEAHARSLFTMKQDGETATEFVGRMRSKLIAREEWNALNKINGKHANHYETLPPLPKWEDVKPFLDDLIAQLDEALAQPPSSTQHPEKVTNELPF